MSTPPEKDPSRVNDYDRLAEEFRLLTVSPNFLFFVLDAGPVKPTW